MRFRVHQKTVYHYSIPVFLEPHLIRLRPRSESSQEVLSWDMAIEPRPAQLTWANDAEGNSTAYAWFERLTKELHITTRFEVETLRKNTFDFLWLDGSDRLGFAYAERDALATYLDFGASPGALATRTLEQSAGDTAGFLTALNQHIHGLIRVVIREDGGPYSPEETLSRGEGACRDLAWLFVASCREVGLAARFVSGYQAGDPGLQERYLHAWAEVYLPGGGWRGFDPTLGLAVADQHVVIATAAKPADAAPVSGSFRGSGATAQMETTLSVSTGL